MPKRHPAIIAAWIAGGFAIATPAITYFVTRAAEAHLFQDISEDRRTAIEGHWTGVADQEFRGHPVSYPAELDLEVRGRDIRGRLHVDLKDGGQEYTPTFELSGGFLHDRFLRLEYASNAKGSVHFGAMILELSPDTTVLSGNFVAFGAYSQMIVPGSLRFARTK